MPHTNVAWVEWFREYFRTTRQPPRMILEGDCEVRPHLCLHPIVLGLL